MINEKKSALKNRKIIFQVTVHLQTLRTLLTALQRQKERERANKTTFRKGKQRIVKNSLKQTNLDSIFRVEIRHMSGKITNTLVNYGLIS